MTTRSNPLPVGRGVLAAVVLSACGAAVLAALTPPLGAAEALRLVTALLGLGYVVYSIGQSGQRIGRIATLVVWLVVAVGAWVAGLPVAAYVLVHIGFIWLVRALYFYSGVLPALVDLALTALGVAFAVWAADRTHSAAIAFWCFFLAQAFHALIPAALVAQSDSRAETDGFDRAHRAAEAALRRLSGAP
jgi:hypothetical protein